MKQISVLKHHQSAGGGGIMNCVCWVSTQYSAAERTSLA